MKQKKNRNRNSETDANKNRTTKSPINKSTNNIQQSTQLRTNQNVFNQLKHQNYTQEH